ncbi:hypothetical protein F2P81_015882 [Scophthalmus maximus]|uniref:Uncharacterized protein n=1 Tax=Scophthalmus maximus TaxID=52904 RepID=A0A6A4SDP1_SCOMX|nr:hypothetical protein F2P81_015882 [Scophthalmus maximus]
MRRWPSGSPGWPVQLFPPPPPPPPPLENRFVGGFRFVFDSRVYVARVGRFVTGPIALCSKIGKAWVDGKLITTCSPRLTLFGSVKPDVAKIRRPKLCDE